MAASLPSNTARCGKSGSPVRISWIRVGLGTPRKLASAQQFFAQAEETQAEEVSTGVDVPLEEIIVSERLQDQGSKNSLEA